MRCAASLGVFAAYRTTSSRSDLSEVCPVAIMTGIDKRQIYSAIAWSFCRTSHSPHHHPLVMTTALKRFTCSVIFCNCSATSHLAVSPWILAAKSSYSSVRGD